MNKVTFGTNWLAPAEHGGFYQSMSTTGCTYASGIYKDYNLDVTIKMGGPQVASGTQLFMGGGVDFFMGYGIDAVNAIAQGISKITVAAIFQKALWCLIAHPNTAIKTLADLKGKPIYVSASANITYVLYSKQSMLLPMIESVLTTLTKFGGLIPQQYRQQVLCRG